METHQEFFRSLSQEEVQLLILRKVLYAGSWGEMIQDLEARRDGKPYIFKLNSRIEEDLARIAKLREYEDDNRINLSDYVPKGSA